MRCIAVKILHGVEVKVPEQHAEAAEKSIAEGLKAPQPVAEDKGPSQGVAACIYGSGLR